MEKSENINELATALAKAQGKFKPLTKGRTATVKMKSGQTYSYSYADLHDVIESVKEALSENGLSISQGVISPPSSDGNEFLRTHLFHASGQFISNNTPIIAGLYSDGGPQAFASSLTYSRRYGACALLGVVADEDDDSQMANDNHKAKSSPAKAPHKNPQDGTTARPTDAQLKRMWAICKAANWTEVDLRSHIKKTCGIDSTKELTWLQYENLCKVIESMPKPKPGVNSVGSPE